MAVIHRNPPKQFKGGDSEYHCFKTLTPFWFPWLGGGVQKYGCGISKHTPHSPLHLKVGKSKYHGCELLTPLVPCCYPWLGEGGSIYDCIHGINHKKFH
jgi:hypothetical protein